MFVRDGYMFWCLTKVECYNSCWGVYEIQGICNTLKYLYF